MLDTIVLIAFGIAIVVVGRWALNEAEKFGRHGDTPHDDCFR